MIIYDSPQGTEQWLNDRSGVITASMFETVCKRLKNGEFSEAAKKYARKLAIERISGQALPGAFETYYMRRGRELEADAIEAYEFLTGAEVTRQGFISTDDRVFGASVDGVTSDGGIVEVKAFIDPDKVVGIVVDNDFACVEAQALGGMEIVGARYCDMILYCPPLAPIGKDLISLRLDSDQERQEEMFRKHLVPFNELVEEIKQAIIESKTCSAYRHEG